MPDGCWQTAHRSGASGGAFEVEAPARVERAVLVHMDVGGHEDNQEEFGEFRALANSAGVESVHVVWAGRRDPDPAFFVGRGKVEEIRAVAAQSWADVVLLNHDLSPGQERNLERAIGCRVIDRTRLILDIFAQRASSFEGKLQVERAQLQHLATRLVRGWTHLERQKGGIGLRGPGETQLETDRRLVASRIRQIDRRLARLRMQRQQGRKSRRRVPLPTACLVGYTNAGKSTLFNRLTNSAVAAENRLFATLDPTVRRLQLGDVTPMLLADTVGFIRHLPHHLVEAFQSTLDETREASLLLHVIDGTHDNRDACVVQVKSVLRDIGADGIPCIEVYNKVDAVPGGEARIDRNADGSVRRVWLSAATGKGLDLLLEVLREHSASQVVCRHLNLPPQAARLRSRLFALGAVRSDQVNERGEWEMQVELRPQHLHRLREQPDFAVHLGPG
jgi:GTP-binding protein HflX